MEMDIEPDITCLQNTNVILPGGHDREGRPLILVNIPQESRNLDIIPPLQYLLAIFSESTRARGLTVILDARKGPWKVARSCIRQIGSAFAYEEPPQFIVLRPDGFWDKQRVENCTHAEGQVIFIPRCRLNRFVEQSQLPLELSGNFIYNHEKWMANRQKIDDFYKLAKETTKDLDGLCKYLDGCQNLGTRELETILRNGAGKMDAKRLLITNTCETGQRLLHSIEQSNRTRKLASDTDSMSTPQETLDSLSNIDHFLMTLKNKQRTLEELWQILQKTLTYAQDIQLLEEGMTKITSWILGPGEHLLNCNQKLGYDVVSAEERIKEHEKIEFQFWKIHAAYAELVYNIDTFPNVNYVHYKDLVSQKDFMDFVYRGIVARLEKRRNILSTSLRFFKLVSEYYDRTGEVFDSFVLGNQGEDFEGAADKLKELLKNQSNLEALAHELVKEGERYSEMLTMPFKDSLGREIFPGYSEDAVSIRDTLDAATARKNIFTDSVELQKFTLANISSIYNYEKDALQAIQWLDDLFGILLDHHKNVGCSVHEIQWQKDELQLFQESAKDTYNYGLQLLCASLQLRQGCSLKEEEHDTLMGKLKFSWERFLNVTQEQMTRLRISSVFHRNIDEHCKKLKELCEAVKNIHTMSLNRRKNRVRKYYDIRMRLTVEVGRMIRLGKLLVRKLKEPLYPAYSVEVYEVSLNDSDLSSDEEISSEFTIGDNYIAIKTISEKIAEVIDLTEEVAQLLRSAQQNYTCGFGTMDRNNADSSASANVEVKLQKPEDDDEFVTASECTLQHSRSSSYNTASEAEQRFSPWWEYDKNDHHSTKEKMVLAVGLPDLPPPESVLKPSPEVPPGKIAHEVVETTHIKVQHSHTMGVASFVLTSETVRDGGSTEGLSRCAEGVSRGTKGVSRATEGVSRGTQAEAVDRSTKTVQQTYRTVFEDKRAAEEPRDVENKEFEDRMKEVSEGCDEDAWKLNATKRAIKGFI